MMVGAAANSLLKYIVPPSGTQGPCIIPCIITCHMIASHRSWGFEVTREKQEVQYPKP